MPKAFFIRLFDHWLSQHRADFRHPPMAVRRFKRHVTFRFKGIVPSIWGAIKECGFIEVGVDHHGQCWDLLADFDIAPKRLPGGNYICEYCEEATRTIYPTREALWIEHGFESLRAWCNAELRADRQMVLFGTEDGGGRWACLKPLSYVPAMDAHLVARYPLAPPPKGAICESA